MEHNNKCHIYKTAWFSKNPVKAGVSNQRLCEAAKEVISGFWDADLGANVFKKRLLFNRYRSIIISKTEHYLIFVYLFAKADRENINQNELKGFKKTFQRF